MEDSKLYTSTAIKRELSIKYFFCRHQINFYTSFLDNSNDCSNRERTWTPLPNFLWNALGCGWSLKVLVNVWREQFIQETLRLLQNFWRNKMENGFGQTLLILWLHCKSFFNQIQIHIWHIQKDYVSYLNIQRIEKPVKFSKRGPKQQEKIR